ncbi:MAG: archaellin/type IV pilin N-terminal domain-containing protein [Candidatus Woesearchaeota archaeon]
MKHSRLKSSRFSRKAEMAMGTLIIFIAMILIAAVAAAVLITTISNLQTKALETGKATRQEIGTNLQILEIYGTDGSSGSSINNITILSKLNAGSEAIRFDDLLITLSLSNQTTDYKFNETMDCSEIEGTNYAVEYSITGNNNVTGYLTSGDVAKVCFIATSQIGESEYFRLSLIPKVGTPTILETLSPSTISKTREYIFP